MKNYHLAVLKKEFADLILQGKKTIELRLTKTKRPPFGRIKAEDKIFFKISSGPVVVTAIVSNVTSYSKLTPAKIIAIGNKYNHRICAPQEFFESRLNFNYCLLIELKEVKKIDPININKNDMLPWVILSEKQNYGLI